MAERQGIPPSGVVLAGTFSRGMDGPTGSDSLSRNLAWQVFRTSLSKKILNEIEGSNPLGLSEYGWNSFLYQGLAYGKFVKNGHIEWPLKEQLMLMTTDPSHLSTLMSLAPTAWGSTQDDEDDSMIVFKQVSCHEIQNYVFGIKYSNGRFVDDLKGKNHCEGIALDRPYDSKKWPIRAPLFYISGTADPITPPAQALEHLRSHPDSRRTFISIEFGGHQSVGRFFNDCQGKFWASVSEGGANLASDLKSCIITPRVQQFPSGH